MYKVSSDVFYALLKNSSFGRKSFIRFLFTEDLSMQIKLSIALQSRKGLVVAIWTFFIERRLIMGLLWREELWEGFYEKKKNRYPIERRTSIGDLIIRYSTGRRWRKAFTCLPWKVLSYDKIINRNFIWRQLSSINKSNKKYSHCSSMRRYADFLK